MTIGSRSGIVKEIRKSSIAFARCRHAAWNPTDQRFRLKKTFGTAENRIAFV